MSCVFYHASILPRVRRRQLDQTHRYIAKSDINLYVSLEKYRQGIRYRLPCHGPSKPLGNMIGYSKSLGE
jgi:hypothetical protein